MKKVLFIDRDGTLIVEPEDEQIDSYDKLEFVSGAITALSEISRSTDYLLVMVTNQDGLGTDSFPEDTFWPAHNLMLRAFSSQGVAFDKTHIDRTRPEDNSNTRKPGTGMLNEYIYGDYNLADSFVIGDRVSDVELAQNLGCKSIFFNDSSHPDATYSTDDWSKVVKLLQGQHRTARVTRTTLETQIDVKVDLDGQGKAKIDTAIGFFDHMLEQIAKHGGIDLEVTTRGDLNVDAHHTIEDTALALGQAFSNALGSRHGIQRYGFSLPMDDALTQVVIDFGGRPWIVWNTDFKREKIGDMPTEMFFHFFKSLSDTAMCNINITSTGQNEHHMIESIFKCFARAVRMAKTHDASVGVPSTKGVL